MCAHVSQPENPASVCAVKGAALPEKPPAMHTCTKMYRSPCRGRCRCRRRSHRSRAPSFRSCHTTPPDSASLLSVPLSWGRGRGGRCYCADRAQRTTGNYVTLGSCRRINSVPFAEVSSQRARTRVPCVVAWNVTHLRTTSNPLASVFVSGPSGEHRRWYIVATLFGQMG